MTDTPEQAPPAAHTFPDVVRDVFTRFPEFARAYLGRPHPPSQYIMIWLVGMDAVAGTIELEFVQRGSYLIDNWLYAWARVMLVGLPAGVARYWLIGTVFHGIVRIAGGHGSMRLSRHIFLYSTLPVVVADLSIKVLQMLIYGNDYFAGQTGSTFDAVAAGVMLGAYAGSLRLAYIAMRELTGAERLRSILLLVTIAVVVSVLMMLVVT